MVCPRCVMAVKDILDKMEIPWSEVVLGRATVNVPQDEIDMERLDKELRAVGFELINDKDLILVERVKTLIINRIHHSEAEDFNDNFSDYLSAETGVAYGTLSKIFSELTDTTISSFIIAQRLEKVKELISYGELNFSEIAYRTGYSSTAHLSRQFKKLTGLTLSQFRSKMEKREGIQ